MVPHHFIVGPFFIAPDLTKVFMANLTAIEIPDKLMFLIQEHHRYKVAWGGRYGFKSWSFARAIISLCFQKTTRVLCCREIQKSIKDSVLQLLSDQITTLGLKSEFEVLNTEIRNKVNGSKIIFDGLRDSTIDIKSKEGIDICWVEEAENLSEESFNKLYPTIRKDGSEIWISFNTTDEDAFVFERFVTNPDDNCKVVRTFWYENPFINETMRQEALNCKARDSEGYKHIWLGEPSKTGLRVYPHYNEKVHVKPLDFDYMAEHGNFFVGMDPHKTAYPATLFGCKIPTNSDKTEFDYYVYNEFPTKNDLHGKLYYEVRKTAKCSYTQKSLTGIFKTLETTVQGKQNKNVNVLIRACDPYFAKGVGGSDWSSDTDGLVQEWARPENGGIVWTLPERKVLCVQKNTVNELMKYNDEMPISAINRPSFYVAPHCQNLLTSLKLHRDSSEKDTEDEKHKDFSDALRILMSVMHYTPYRSNVRNVTAQILAPHFNKSIFARQTTGIR